MAHGAYGYEACAEGDGRGYMGRACMVRSASCSRKAPQEGHRGHGCRGQWYIVAGTRGHGGCGQQGLVAEVPGDSRIALLSRTTHVLRSGPIGKLGDCEVADSREVGVGETFSILQAFEISVRKIRRTQVPG